MIMILLLLLIVDVNVTGIAAEVHDTCYLIMRLVYDEGTDNEEGKEKEVQEEGRKSKLHKKKKETEGGRGG